MGENEKDRDEINQEAEEENRREAEQDQEEQAQNDAENTENNFSHSLDDDDETPEEDEQDNDDNNRRRKKDKDDDDDDKEDDKDEQKDEEDTDADDADAEDGDGGGNNSAEDDAAEDLDKAGQDADEQIDSKDDLQDGQGDNTSDFDTNPDADKPKDPDADHGDSEPKEQKPEESDGTEAGKGDNVADEAGTEGADPAEAGDTGEAGIDAGDEAGVADSGTMADAGAEGTEGALAETGTTAEMGASTAEAGAVEAGAAEGAAGAGAAEGAAGGAAGAAGGAGAGAALGIAALVILIIIVIIGVIGFFTTMPQFLWNKLKEIALSIWDGIQGYVIGMDEAGVNQDDIVVAAQYLYDMGYDLVGMGFAEEVEIAGQKDANGHVVEVTDEHPENAIVSINAPYLRSYLVAENRTYLVNNYTFNLKDFCTSFFNGEFFSDDGTSAWGTGLINLVDESGLGGFLKKLAMPLYGVRLGEFNIGEAIEGVKIMRDTNTMRIRRLNLELAVWKSHFDYMYYSLEGWSGRYGKPFELMVTLHVATMAPDLVKEFALNNDLDAKVNVRLEDVTFSGVVLVDGKDIDTLEEEDELSEDTIKWLKKLQKDKASEIKTSMPYLTSVTSHWFRNVYFEGTKSLNASGHKVGSKEVGVDEDADGLEDYNETSGMKTQKTRTLTADDNVYKKGTDVSVSFAYTDSDMPSELEGKEVTMSGVMEDGIAQTKEAVRGVTNPTTKKIFADEYYIYDGTVERAKEIQKARSSGSNKVRKEKINLTKNSLQAFSILEGSDTLDSQFIYRDLKELVIEIGYFEREDFYEIEKQVLEWPVPEYVPADWPDKGIEKQVIEYGTLIACDETVAHSIGVSLADLQKFTKTEDENDDDDEDDEDDLKELKGYVFIGDEYVTNLKASGLIEDGKFYGKEGSGPQYWLDHMADLPDKIKKCIIATGVNDPKKYESMKGLIDALDEKYDGIQIYVIEVTHVTETHTDADAYNKLIDTYNSHVRNKCKTQANATMIDASLGFVQRGYLIDNDTTGRHISTGSYEKWCKNIINKLKIKNIGTNDTDERFVVDFLKSAKEITSRLNQNDYEYGTPEFIPPRVNGAINEENGYTDADKGRKISGDKFVAWALYKSGYIDQPENGLSVGEDGDFLSYCEGKDWTKISSVGDLQAGDIVFLGTISDEKEVASHVYICAGEGKRYEIASASDIKAEQPLSKSVESNFICAYRVTGDGLINTGLKEGLDVIAMGNGVVKEVLDAEHNIYTQQYLAKSVYGEDANTEFENDPVEGREQSLEGLRIKLKDNALRGYTLIMYGFDVASGIGEGSEIKVGDVIGKSLHSDIVLILIDRDRAIIDNIEDYMKVPKKEKQVATMVDWELFYWLPFESGAADTTNSYIAGRYTGPACVSSCSSGEVAIGIIQWTSLTGSGTCNQRDQFLPFMKENYPQFYSKLSFLEGKGPDYYWSDYQGANAVQAALLECDNMDHETFLQAQIDCAKATYYEPLIEKHPWIENRPLCVQAEILHLYVWGPATVTDVDSHQSDSDKDLLAYVRHKIANTSSTAGPGSGDENSGRAFNEPEIAYGILDGKLTEAEIEEFVRKADFSILTSNGIAQH